MKQLVELLESSVVIALVLAGIGGIAYHLFREGGWIAMLLGNFWGLQTRNILILITLAAAAVILFRLWRRGRAVHSKTSILPTLVLYALMACGAYFIGRYAITGAI